MPSLVTAAEYAKFPVDAVMEEWVNDLTMVFTVNGGKTARPLMRGDCRRWGIDEEIIREHAVSNLVARSHEITMEGSRTEGYTMLALSNPDPHNAARILLPDLHKKLREHLGGTFYAALPSREFFLAFNTDREEVLTRVRNQVAADFTKSKTPLSPKLFLVTADGIAGDPQEAENYSALFGDKWK